MNGILNVYKEPGFTSFDVVAKLRGICKQKKIGHTGTLDPDASGVLPVCLGNATKLCDMLTDRSKQYRSVMLLGCVTDTQDMTGRVLKECPAEATEEEVRQAIASFVGEYDQIPPMYSALKVNGKKLCDLARAGKEVERKSRRVTIHSIEIEEMALPYVTMKVDCSKGTYIRTLCHDIGQKLGCGAAMDSLVRTRCGQFVLEEAYRLSEIEALAASGELERILMPTDQVFLELPACRVKKEYEVLVRNGNPLEEGQLLEGADAARGQFQAYGEADAARGRFQAYGEADAACGRFQAYGEADAARGRFQAYGEADAAGEPLGAYGGMVHGRIRVYDEAGRFYGIYGWQEEERRFKPVKMFLN